MCVAIAETDAPDSGVNPSSEQESEAEIEPVSTVQLNTIDLLNDTDKMIQPVTLHLGDKVINLRKEMDFTQNDLSEMLVISRTTLSCLEKTGEAALEVQLKLLFVLETLSTLPISYVPQLIIADLIDVLKQAMVPWNKRIRKVYFNCRR